jgi:quercetin dioxygenase-like cupin family protein
MEYPRVLREQETEVIEDEWGSLTWHASARLGNAEKITVGRAVIKPGMRNPSHSHPNCEEVLVVLQGTIAHAAGSGEEAVLHAGDTITIPEGFPHNARNTGDADAVLLIAYSSATRETRGE